ncbi:MAG: helix-turn-helix transcriptional regulator [Bacteroidaceae bacterium]|nr:helix-turn-helix transcriptional regulator [Bacteroidaceae bacterium]
MKNLSELWDYLVCHFQPQQELIKLRCKWMPQITEGLPLDAQKKYVDAIRLLVVPCVSAIPYLLDMRDAAFCRFIQRKKILDSDYIVEESPFNVLFDTILEKTEKIPLEELELGYFTCNLPFHRIENTRHYNITMKPLEWTSLKKVWLFLVQIKLSYNCDFSHELLFHNPTFSAVEHYHWTSDQWILEKEMKLSVIEKEIIQYSLAGLNSKEIAERTRYKENSINTYRCNLLEKLHVHNICEAIAKCQKYNMLD